MQEDTIIFNSKEEKLLGIAFDNNLSLETHLNKICKTASNKISALARLSSFMNVSKKRLIMNAFFTSQFNYCRLVYMFHSRKMNNRINRLQERCLRIVYDDTASTYEELLLKDNSVSNHHKNLQALAIELYKMVNNLSPKFLIEVFPFNNSYDPRTRSDLLFKSRPIKSTFHGSESLSFLAPKIWNIIPNDIKKAKNLSIFKKSIKKWVTNDCPCHICKNYISWIGFVTLAPPVI